MKRTSNGKQKVVKGTSSAVLLSILIHIGLFLLAGTLVIFTVVKHKEVEFEPPKAVERPKMKLKKPKVRVKKSSRPKSTARIVTKANRPAMPSMDLPEMSGLGGGGFGGDGISGFDIMPDLADVTIFGGGQTIGNDFIGTLYDFKRTRDGRNTGIDPGGFLFELAKFTKGNWDEAKLAKYYKSPKKLYTTHFMIPTITSDIAPTAFGEPDMMGYAWAAYYEGQIVHPKGGTFRFWAQADDVIIVRLNEKIVVDGSVSDSGKYGNFRNILSGYNNMTAESMQYYMGDRQAAVGEWFTLEPGVPMKMEVVIGESPGGSFSSMLAIQEKGVVYPKSPQGGPLLPMFKTAEPTHAVLDSIFEYLIEGEACPTNGPVFSDYGSQENTKAGESGKEQEPLPALESEIVEDGPPSMRTWALNDGKSLEATYVCTIGRNVVLKPLKGKDLKFSTDLLSTNDLEYIELLNPPDLKIDFRSKSRQRMIATRDAGVMGLPPIVLQWTFGAKVKQTNVGDYNQELKIDYYAFGQQVIDRNKYILLDKGSTTFTPSPENDRSHEFMNDRMVELWTFTKNGQSQGREFFGGLVVVTDKTGKIIAHSASKKWMMTHLDALKQLPVGAFMDDTCTRVYASGPKATKY